MPLFPHMEELAPPVEPRWELTPDKRREEAGCFIEQQEEPNRYIYLSRKPKANEYIKRRRERVRKRNRVREGVRDEKGRSKRERREKKHAINWYLTDEFALCHAIFTSETTVM